MNSTVIKIILFRVFTVFILAIIPAGCVQQTTYRLEPAHGTGVTQQSLQQNWSDYFIHYNTRIVVFDSILDDLTIQVGDRWVLIEDPKELTEIFYRLELMPREGLTEIYQIVDSRGILFGYLIYDSGDLVSFKKIDDNKMKLYYQPQRPPDAP